MTTAYKVLGQVESAATTLTSLYTAGAGVQAVGSTLSVCNRAGTTKIRVAVRPAGAAIANAHYLVYDATLDANDTLLLTLGITLAPTDVVSVYSVSGSVAFSLFGSEIS